MVDVFVHRRLLFCVEKKESAFDFCKRDCDREISGVSESRLGPRKFLAGVLTRILEFSPKVLTRFKFKKNKRSQVRIEALRCFYRPSFTHAIIFFDGYIYLIFPGLIDLRLGCRRGSRTGTCGAWTK